MVKIEEYGEYLNNYDSKVKTCFMAHNSKWLQVIKVEKRFSNLTFDTFSGSTNYLNIYKSRVSNDYDLIILDSLSDYSDCELERMKKMALNISKNKNKRVTIAYNIYTRSRTDVVAHYIIIYSIKDDKCEEEIITIPISKERLMCNSMDLLVLALEKHGEYNNQKQFKK